MSELEKLPGDLIMAITQKLDVDDCVNFISASRTVGKSCFENNPLPTDAEKLGFFIIKLMFEVVKLKDDKKEIVQKYSYNTINSKIQLTIYVNNSECGCIISRDERDDSRRGGSSDDDSDDDSDYDSDDSDSDDGSGDDSDAYIKTNVPSDQLGQEFWESGSYTTKNIKRIEYKLGVLKLPSPRDKTTQQQHYNNFESFMRMFTKPEKASYYFYKRLQNLEDIQYVPYYYSNGIRIDTHVFTVMQKHMFYDIKQPIEPPIYNTNLLLFLVQLRSLEEHTKKLETLWDS